MPVTPSPPTANRFVIMPSLPPCSSTPCSSSPCSPPSSLKLGSVLRPAVCCLAQFCAPAHLRSASAMALRAGAPSHRLRFPNSVHPFVSFVFSELPLCSSLAHPGQEVIPLNYGNFTSDVFIDSNTSGNCDDHHDRRIQQLCLQCHTTTKVSCISCCTIPYNYEPCFSFPLQVKTWI